MKTITLLFSIIILFSLPNYLLKAQEDTTTHIIDKALDECMEQYYSTHGMVACIDTAYQSWDAELNKIYQKLKLALDAKQKAALKKAQLAWIEQRDAEVELIGAIYASKQGTMYRPMASYEIVDIVKQRALDLAAYYDLLQE